MICKNCGKEFIGLFSEVCPYCGTDNSVSLGEFFDSLLAPEEKSEHRPNRIFVDDPYDFENPDNCSEEEYFEDDEFDDYDNF